MNNKFLKEQGTPLVLTVLTFLGLCGLLYIFIHILNLLPTGTKIIPTLRTRDVVFGLIIYLKTSIDFAIFIGNLMRTNPGMKKRIAIELGTAAGNAAGTILILFIWNVFREVPLLMAVMIFVASLVLLRMSEESFEGLKGHYGPGHKFHKPINFIQNQLMFVNRIFKPVLGRLIPNLSITNSRAMPFLSLVVFSITVPFILGLDDFAGYIPLFSVINVFGFAVGVFLGHMILNLGLFVSPKTTTKIVEGRIMLAVGGVAFVGIAVWGFYEALKLVSAMLH